MADKSLVFRLIGDPTAFNAAMLSASGSSSKLARTLGTTLGPKGAAGKGIAGLTKSVGFLPVGLGLAGGAAAAVGVAFGKTVSIFANFDQAMSAVAASTGATGAELDSLRDAAVEMGAETKFGATEAARGIEALAKAGVSTADIIGGGLKGALDLAAAGEIEVGAAADVAADAMVQFGLSGRDVPHIADLLAAAAGKAQGNVDDMSQALKQSGLVASQMGLSVEETTGTLAAFASNALTGSDAGTAFRTMLLRLANPTGKSAELMAELGIAAYDSQGAFVGIEALAGQLQTRLGALTQEQRNAALATIFGSDAIRAANVLYSEGASGIGRWTDEVNDQGFAAEQAAKRTDNLKGDVEKLGGALESLAIDQGGGANDMLRELTQTLTDLIEVTGEADRSTRGFFETLAAQETATGGATTFGAGVIAGLDAITAGGFSAVLALDRGTAAAEDASVGLTGYAGWLARTAEEELILGAETDRLTGQAEAYAAQTAAGTTQIQLQAEELAGLRQEYYDTANAILGLSDANIGYEQSIDDAQESLAEHGKTLDITTEAGRANQRSLDGVARSALGVVKQMYETGASEEEVVAKSKYLREGLYQTALAFFGNEKKAADYVDRLFTIPASRNTAVSVTGAGAATRYIEDLRRAILRLPSGKTVRISYISSVSGATVGSGITRADGGIIPGYPGGGLIRGIGGPRQDMNLAAVSAGEFVVNAADTARNRGLLEHINSGGRLGGGDGRTVLEIRSGGRAFDDALVEVLRRAVNHRGGNVQQVLGRPR
jgi:TP901 family phage tail tape measure protein